MDCKEKDYRSFSHHNESYYAKSLPLSQGVVDDIYFGLSCGGGGTHGEMKMEWTELGGRSVPQLKVYDDAWGVLASFTDLLTEMASVTDDNITPKEFCEMLIRCGFKDTTQRKNPRPAAARSHTPSRQEFLQALSAIATLPSCSGNGDAKAIASKALGIETQP